MKFARYVRLYADRRGDTHFEDIKVPLEIEEFVPPAGPINIADFLPVSSSFLLGAPADWNGDMPHPSPRRQLLCTVQGEYEITVSDGEVRCFPAGSILLLEDTTGKGHKTNITYSKGVLVFGVVIDDSNNERKNS